MLDSRNISPLPGPSPAPRTARGRTARRGPRPVPRGPRPGQRASEPAGRWAEASWRGGRAPPRWPDPPGQAPAWPPAPGRSLKHRGPAARRRLRSAPRAPHQPRPGPIRRAHTRGRRRSTRSHALSAPRKARASREAHPPEMQRACPRSWFTNSGCPACTPTDARQNQTSAPKERPASRCPAELLLPVWTKSPIERNPQLG